MNRLPSIILALLFFLLLNFPVPVENISANGKEEELNIPIPDTSVSLPIGMNLHGLNYYTPAPIFTDVMTTASGMISFYTDESGSPWNSGMINEIMRDHNGYPMFLPQLTSDGHQSCVRFLINNYYKGRYRVLFDGEGIMVAGGHRLKSDEHGPFIDLDGSGGNTWIDIIESKANNYIRNIHIIPEEYGLFSIDDYDSSVIPTFLAQYTEGLESFHALRFMDWFHTNGSTQVDWGEDSYNNATPNDFSDDRITKDYYSQAADRGISMEYAIELCNTLQTDAWVCVPHMASDDYIRKMADLWRDNLDENLTIYLEYSNEVWNWAFVQSKWVSQNGVYGEYPLPVDNHVQTALAEIESKGGDFPEKDAYMMARSFSIWADEFGSAMSSRVIRVATGQHAVPSRLRKVLEYLSDEKEAYGAVGCDALAVGGYFSFSEEDHEKWLTLGDSLTMEEIYKDTYRNFLKTSKIWTEGCASVAKDFDVKYYVYEGGQHMQPYNQQEWNYNEKLWDFQISDYMYDLYIHNFDLLTDPEIDCDLFMAFSYISKRKSRYGSWGHLESLDQVGTEYANAPKFSALMDVNTP